MTSICLHEQLTLTERPLIKNNEVVRLVDIVLCTKCGYFAFAAIRKNKKSVKLQHAAKKLPTSKPTLASTTPTKPQTKTIQKQPTARTNSTLQNKEIETPKKIYGADNNHKQAVASDILDKQPTNPAPKTESKKDRKK